MRPLLDAEAVAQLLGQKRSWVYDEVQAGRLPHIRLGRSLRFRPEDIEHVVEAAYAPARAA